MSKFKTYAHYLEVMKLGKEKWTEACDPMCELESLLQLDYLRGVDAECNSHQMGVYLNSMLFKMDDLDSTLRQIGTRGVTEVADRWMKECDNLILTQARLNRSPKEAAEVELYIYVSNPELRTRDIPWAARVYADCMTRDLGFPDWSDEGLAEFLMEQMDADWPDLYMNPPSVTWVKEDRIRSMALKLVDTVRGVSLDAGVGWAISVERSRIKDIVEAAVAERAAKLEEPAHA